MSFIRPEVTRWMIRWRETILATGLSLAGLLTILHGLDRYNWLTQAIGVVLALLGGALFLASYQRTLFANSRKGPGLVEVTERQITYLASDDGASVDIAAMTRLELRTSVNAERMWVLKQSEGPTLFIPTGAAGAEKLFDAFAILPGIDTSRLISALNSTGNSREIVWRGDPKYRALT